MKFFVKLLLTNLIGGLVMTLTANAAGQLWDEVLKDKTHNVIAKIKTTKKES